ncbi:hypothetical protein [Alkalihalobacterium chitinilyticum]|uniref:Uncharacterized protein n=1 Tax=Alkalihalobacterium chitinilyticum TaxID=2980103 RepID=A0ABT5VLM5_9BACI|nr:hypothetical protein [Alkalihalobacterium chitinilyticum]MDE5416345.1 hypothetical protein [Alkalihalobacterium chitinilyticum]
MYQINSGHMYGGLTFTLNGQNMFKEMVETDDLFATWSSLLSYYEIEGFQPKQSRELFFGQITFMIKNGRDSKNPQVQFVNQYERMTTVWVPFEVLKQAIAKGFVEFMAIVKEEVINHRVDEDGDPFEMHHCLPYLLERYKEISRKG